MKKIRKLHMLSVLILVLSILFAIPVFAAEKTSESAKASDSKLYVKYTGSKVEGTRIDYDASDDIEVYLKDSKGNITVIDDDDWTMSGEYLLLGGITYKITFYYEDYSCVLNITGEYSEENKYKTPGQIVKWGVYEQDNNPATIDEPIEWIVMDYDEEQNCSLLLSRKILDYQEYNSDNSEACDSRWGDSFIRSWLNLDFSYEAFTDDEWDYVMICETDDPDPEGYAESELYLLNSYEMERFKALGTWKNAAPTSYAKSISSTASNTCWLRDGGNSNKSLKYTYDQNGSIKSQRVNSLAGIRPVFWLDLEFLSNETLAESAADHSTETAPSNEETTNQNASDRILYDEEGYIILKYEIRDKLKDLEKPNVHLTGTLIDADNSCFTIKDGSGHIWTGGSAGGLDFTGYIGTECDIYGFCAGGIHRDYQTPYVDMAYDDSHISFSDGLSYYPKDNESYAQFPRWNFEGEQNKKGSGWLVWIPTDGGTRYHSHEKCSGMYNPIQVTEQEAIDRGFSRCGKCW